MRRDDKSYIRSAVRFLSINRHRVIAKQDDTFLENYSIYVLPSHSSHNSIEYPYQRAGFSERQLLKLQSKKRI